MTDQQKSGQFFLKSQPAAADPNPLPMANAGDQTLPLTTNGATDGPVDKQIKSPPAEGTKITTGSVNPLFEKPNIMPPQTAINSDNKPLNRYNSSKKSLPSTFIVVLAFFFAIAGLTVGLLLAKKPRVGEIRKLAGTGWCNADPIGTDYGSPCQVADPGQNECGGDGKETYCGIGPDPIHDRRTTGTWHATGNCCEEPTPGAGNMSCTTISTDVPHLEINVQNDTNNNRSYQLNKCECNSKDLPCEECNYSQPGLAGHTSRREMLDLNGNCGSIQLDVSPIGGEFTACYAWYSSEIDCAISTPTPTPTRTLTPTPTPTPVIISANCSSLTPQVPNEMGGWTDKTDAEFEAEVRPGDRVRFVCTGVKTQGIFIKAAFFINNILYVDDVIKLNDNQFAVEYTVAAAGPLQVGSVLLHDNKGWVD